MAYKMEDMNGKFIIHWKRSRLNMSYDSENVGAPGWLFVGMYIWVMAMPPMKRVHHQIKTHSTVDVDIQYPREISSIVMNLRTNEGATDAQIAVWLVVSEILNNKSNIIYRHQNRHNWTNNLNDESVFKLIGRWPMRLNHVLFWYFGLFFDLDSCYLFIFSIVWLTLGHLCDLCHCQWNKWTKTTT